MVQHKESADDEGIQLTYTTLLSGTRLHTPSAALPYAGGLAPSSVRASRGAWLHTYRRVLNVAFLGALFALGVLLGTVVSGYAGSLRSSSLPSRPSLHALPATTAPTTVVGAVPGTAAPLDARFAVVTLGIQCLRETCDGSRYVPAGQRVSALQAGASCTTTTPAEVVGRRVQYVYCRLDQPNVFTATFDGAQFFCVGSRLGCHFVLRVETANGR
jgi:hypothetical protein